MVKYTKTGHWAKGTQVYFTSEETRETYGDSGTVIRYARNWDGCYGYRVEVNGEDLFFEFSELDVKPAA